MRTPADKTTYFVDEAGDGTLFDRKGRVLVGTSGCSRYFIFGLAEVSAPERVAADLAELRVALLADRYFAGIPSMQANRNRTAKVFHATDDIPEVRERVYRLLLGHDIRFFAVVRDKRRVLEYVRQRNERDQADRADAATMPNGPLAALVAARPAYHYHPNELYDHMVRRLFRDRLHQQDSYVIWFARRGATDRTAMLRSAIAAAQRRFAEKVGATHDTQIDVRPEWAFENPGLQVADYLLWAVQRSYERREDRFIRFVWPLVRLIHDVDDTRRHEYGEYYTKNRPLTLEITK